MSKQDLIIKTYGLEALKTAQYGAGVSVAVANNAIRSDINPYPEISAPQKDAPLYMSKLGTAVFSNLEIMGGSWTDDDGVLHTWDFQKFDTVLMIVDKPKLIVKTAIQGRNGTVKEYISDGDYNINIRLLLIDEPGVAPYQQVSDLKKALDAPTSLEIVSLYLQNLGINNIVIDSYSMPQIEGQYNTQAVEIKALSDEPIELIIK